MPTPSKPVLDNFNRADQYPLGGNWFGSYRPSVGWKISGNRALSASDGTDDWSFYNAVWNDSEVYATISARNTSDGYSLELMARKQSGADTYYTLELTHYASFSDSAVFRKRVAGGSADQIGNTMTPAVDILPGDKYCLQVEYNVIRAYRAPAATGVWAQMGTNFTDSSSPILTPGYPGIAGRFGWAIEDFGGGDITDKVKLAAPDVVAGFSDSSALLKVAPVAMVV